MITPEDFERLKKEAENKANLFEENVTEDQKRFMIDVRDAERDAVRRYMDSAMRGSSPKRLRIKINNEWQEGFIKHLVEKYKESGWEKVSYSFVDRGIREPDGEWTITIFI